MKKLLMTCVAALMLVGATAAITLAEESKNVWKPANRQFKMQSNDFKLTAAAAEVRCGFVYLAGTTPMGNGSEFGEGEAQTGVTTTPNVNQCTHAVTVTGQWRVRWHSENSITECGANEEDPKPEDDCVTLEIPNEGIKVNFGICELKVNANTLKAKFDDDFMLQNSQEASRFEFRERILAVGGTCGVAEAKINASFVIAGLSHTVAGFEVQSGITDD